MRIHRLALSACVVFGVSGATRSAAARDVIKSEIAKYAGVVKAAGIHVE